MHGDFVSSDGTKFRRGFDEDNKQILYITTSWGYGFHIPLAAFEEYVESLRPKNEGE